MRINLSVFVDNNPIQVLKMNLNEILYSEKYDIPNDFTSGGTPNPGAIAMVTFSKASPAHFKN